MSSSRERILVAMSGGVDSSVAAALLQEAGHEVIGAFMRNGVPAEAGRQHRQGCCGIEDAHDARRVADALGIRFYAVDLEARFEELIEGFAESYATGRTPNPCIECNRAFKFGSLLGLAEDLGAVAVATGHYAKLESRNGRTCVARGLDHDKDQSYVLWPLTQHVLARTRLPLGGMTKAMVRAEAERFGLRVANKPESMDICFVPGGDYRAIVRARRPEAFEPGDIVDESGRILGLHNGIAGFTVGQRRGLPGGQVQPLHVLEVDPVNKRVVVGTRDALISSACTLENVVWSGCASLALGECVAGLVQIRAHHEAVAAEVSQTAEGVRIVFGAPAEAVTPGQSAVLYDENGGILLGGVIRSVQRARAPAPIQV
ncbi:MAG: tRNA 2-thiouridine(34) synthase MnmA [Planctomycetes bacterium]|nr:tRNA 2-thiouridine(34) synthase MnmA [Planctomycetota bacterium]